MSAITGDRKKHRPGPKPMAEHITRGSFVLPSVLWDWAVEQPEGASVLLRKLLVAEAKRRGTDFEAAKESLALSSTT